MCDDYNFYFISLFVYWSTRNKKVKKGCIASTIHRGWKLNVNRMKLVSNWIWNWKRICRLVHTISVMWLSNTNWQALGQACLSQTFELGYPDRLTGTANRYFGTHNRTLEVRWDLFMSIYLGDTHQKISMDLLQFWSNSH